MDFSPLILAGIIAVVGVTEGIKSKFPKLSSTLVSIIATIIAAGTLANFDSITTVGIIKFVQSFIFNMICILGGCWLMYGTIISKYRNITNENKQAGSKL